MLDLTPRCSIDGRVFPITANALHLAWDRALARARADYEEECAAKGMEPRPSLLKDLHFHDLRHKAASRLAEKLPNIIELAAVTGHEDVQMLKWYYHPRAEDLARKLG